MPGVEDMSDVTHRDILITMRISRSENAAMYDHFAALGPRLRSFQLRCIGREFYRARRLGQPMNYAAIGAPPPTKSPDDMAAGNGVIYKDIRITLRIKRSEDPDMYDDLTSYGVRYRSFRLRSIAHDYYRAISHGSVHGVTADSPQPATDSVASQDADTSADDAILRAFGKTLGVAATQ